MGEREEMLALALRCEQASGPDRELDAEIGAACGIINFSNPYDMLGTPFFRVTEDGLRVEFCTRLDDGSEHIIASRKPHEFTASLDAAMTLLPASDWEFSLEWQAGSPLWCPDAEMIAIVKIGDPLLRMEAEAATPALALCAASLRARALKEADNG